MGYPEGADGKVWIIGAGGASANQHSIMVQAQGVDGAARLGTGDPAALTRTGGDAAIKGCCQFQGDERQALCNAFKEPCIGGAGLIL